MLWFPVCRVFWPCRILLWPVLELDRYLGSPVLMGEMGAEQKDEVDQLIENDTKRKVRELKKLELDAFMVQKKKEIADATSAITAAQNQNLP
jgi:hypothetical protein